MNGATVLLQEGKTNKSCSGNCNTKCLSLQSFKWTLNFKPNLLKEFNCVQWWLLKFNQIGSFVQLQLSMLWWLYWELLTSIEYAFVFHGLSYWNCLSKMISDMKLKTYFSVIKELLTCSHCLIYMECIIACCLNCFERSSICILNLSLLGCVQLSA